MKKTYNYITNPHTGRKVSIYNKLGKNILKQYLNQRGGECGGEGHTYISAVNNPDSKQCYNEDDILSGMQFGEEDFSDENESRIVYLKKLYIFLEI